MIFALVFVITNLYSGLMLWDMKGVLPVMAALFLFLESIIVTAAMYEGLINNRKKEEEKKE